VHQHELDKAKAFPQTPAYRVQPFLPADQAAAERVLAGGSPRQLIPQTVAQQAAVLAEAGEGQLYIILVLAAPEEDQPTEAGFGLPPEGALGRKLPERAETASLAVKGT
jgi:hypothetical protein